jgi:hypothetical protein
MCIIVIDARQIGIRTAEPLVPGPSCLEVEILIAKLKVVCFNGTFFFQYVRNGNNWNLWVGLPAKDDVKHVL